MSKGTFEFVLDCPVELVTPKTLSNAAGVFSNMAAKAKASDWKMINVAIHSIELISEPTIRDEAADKAFDELTRMAKLPALEDLDRSDVEEYGQIISGMTELVNQTGARINLNVDGQGAVFGAEDLNRMNGLLKKASRITFGRVVGTVDKVILQTNHRTLGLVDSLTEGRVDVKFGKSLDKKVQEITVGMRVKVEGFIRASEGRLLAVDAEDLAIVVDEHRPLVTAEDLEGIIDHELPDGMSSIDFVRQLRDAGGED
jgi:hypothetical protein